MQQREYCVKYRKQTRETLILSKFTILDRVFRHSTRRQNPRRIWQTQTIEDMELRIQREQGGWNFKDSRKKKQLKERILVICRGFSLSVQQSSDQYMCKRKLPGPRKEPLEKTEETVSNTQSKTYCSPYSQNYKPHNPGWSK